MNVAPRPAVQVGTIHYQILCGVGLLLVFFVQNDQGLFLGNLLVASIGLMGIFIRMRMASLLVLIAFALAQIFDHRFRVGTFEQDQIQPLLDIRDLLLAIGILTYLAANYRLQSLTLNILPDDARQRQEKTRRMGRRQSRELVRVQQKRADRLLTPQEIARFVLSVPVWALAGQALWFVITRPWRLPVFPERAHRLFALAWLLTVGILVASTLLAHWRRRQMDGAAAHVYLQDTLWRETRREQRRIFRWLAWRRLHERTDQQSRGATS